MSRTTTEDQSTQNGEREPGTTAQLQPALKQLGRTRCPICRREVSVYLTKTKRAYINCGYCSSRIFFNGQEGMLRLKKRMRPAQRAQ
jgi:DNA-directed RNA polymerase subunit RPC12/RpoP